ncbi:MAG: preprotein translocase subunit YajC [Defluviitaleaceae bacterium]|nr:preprotein translocase subunit YajC [Defluviitaleaceae bacterium]
MENFNFIPLVEIGGGGGETGTATGTPQNGAAEPAGGGGLFGGGPFVLIMWGLIIVGMWFLLIRPQRKREKEVREMQASLKPGENIITTSGFYGKIVKVSADAFLIEFGENRGLQVWVRKSDVAGPKSPSTSAETPATSVETKKDDKEDKEDKKDKKDKR